MKKYEAYKDSGIEWIGMIPEGWECLRMKYFAELVTTPSTSDNKIGLENIESSTGRFIPTNSEFEGNGISFMPDDIVYGKLRPYLQKVWKADMEGNAVGDFFVLRCNSKSYPTYLKYLLLSPNFTSVANGSTYGAKMPRVSSEFIMNFSWFLPSYNEQQAIADYLDYKVGQIDTSVAEINTQIEDLKAYRQAVISEAVTKGLNPNAPMKDSGIEWIGMIPEGWDIISLGYTAIGNNTSFIDGDWIESPYITEEGIRYVTTGNVTPLHFKNSGNSHISEESFEKLNCTEVFPGDILISRLNDPLGKACIVPDIGERIVTSVDCVIYRPNQEKYDSRFMVFYLNNYRYTEYLSTIGRGTTMKRIARSSLAKTAVVAPPLAEQQAIADYLDEKTSKIDIAISSLEVQRNDLNTLRQTVISEAVTGKIDLRDWKNK